MTSLPHLRLFEQPATTNQCVLSCGHRREMPEKPKLRKDGWYSALPCPDCTFIHEVVSVIYVKAKA